MRGLLLCMLAVFTSAVQAQAKPEMARLEYDLRPRQIAERTWIIEGAVEDFTRANGCNIINTAFISTGAGVVVVNTGPSRAYGEQQRRAIERITREPVVRVLSLNLHPDYFFGNQAWADRPTQALAGSISGMQAEGRAYADNLYRLCGDWMKGTESTPSRDIVEPGVLQIGIHKLELRRLIGHTSDDLVLIDHTTGVDPDFHLRLVHLQGAGRRDKTPFPVGTNVLLFPHWKVDTERGSYFCTYPFIQSLLSFAPEERQLHFQATAGHARTGPTLLHAWPCQAPGRYEVLCLLADT